jgi:hypothetical protein
MEVETVFIDEMVWAGDKPSALFAREFELARADWQTASRYTGEMTFRSRTGFDGARWLSASSGGRAFAPTERGRFVSRDARRSIGAVARSAPRRNPPGTLQEIDDDRQTRLGALFFDRFELLGHLRTARDVRRAA